MEYNPYTFTHVVAQYQLLLFSALAFSVLMRTGLYPPELRSTNFDVDWTYRRLLPLLWKQGSAGVTAAWTALLAVGSGLVTKAFVVVRHAHGPRGILARTWPTGSMVLWAAVLLGATVILFYR